MRTIMKITAFLLNIVLCTTFIVPINTGNADKKEPEVAYEKKALSDLTTPIDRQTDLYSTPEPTMEKVVEEAWTYPISQDEIDLIALVTMAEAEGETELGKRLVIDTILNRIDNPHFPDTVHDVIYYPNAFSCIWNGRVDRCCVMPENVELVKEELLERTNYDCVFFTAREYSKYGVPMFQECCHYFSSYE